MTRMFATLLETAGNPTPQPGSLVLVEVPLNCTIHSADAARLSRLRFVAAQLSRCLTERTNSGRFVGTSLPPTAQSLLGELVDLAAGDAAVNELMDAVGGVSEEQKAANTAKLVRPTMESLSR